MATPSLDELAAEVERDIQGYNSAFVEANHRGDPTLMRPWMRLPVTVFGNGTVRMLETPEDVDAQYGRGVDALKGTGYARSILSGFAIRVLNPTTALVECRAVRERADGSVIAAFEATYIMAKGEERWQVACLISRR
jgi:hypothetical protein